MQVCFDRGKMCETNQIGSKNKKFFEEQILKSIEHRNRDHIILLSTFADTIQLVMEKIYKTYPR